MVKPVSHHLIFRIMLYLSSAVASIGFESCFIDRYAPNHNCINSRIARRAPAVTIIRLPLIL